MVLVLVAVDNNFIGILKRRSWTASKLSRAGLTCSSGGGDSNRRCGEQSSVLLLYYVTIGLYMCVV